MKPRVLFYCQHLLGIGHLTRSLAICAELVHQFEVYFIQGGPDVGKTLSHPHFHLHAIAPLMMDEATSELYDPVGTLTPEELLRKRGEQLKELASSHAFDAVITELFPFGRNKLKREILALIAQVKERKPQALICSSVRDILVEKDDGGERARKSAKLIRDHYDLIFVHSDAEIVRLEETFSETESILGKLVYTGFVSESGGELQPLSSRAPQVLVSQGGGVVGGELLLAAARAAHEFPEYHFRMVLGPNAPAPLREKLLALQTEATNKSKPSFSIEPFIPDFENELARSCLSLSLAGYNTIMNLLSTKTPALVLPYKANHEQSLRARKLEERGLLKVLDDSDLEPARLAMLMRERLSTPLPSWSVNLSGARATSQLLLGRLHGQLLVAPSLPPGQDE